MYIKVYIMAILDNYMFRHLLAIFRLSSRELNPLNAELNPICHVLALLELHHILHVSRIRVKVLLYTLCAHITKRSLHTGLIA
jgi:hypothetical protein